MADVQQTGEGGSAKAAAAQARLGSAVALAEWADQAPPSGPQTVAMTFSGTVNKLCGELARIIACYELKEAILDYQDNQVMSQNEDPTLYDKARAQAEKANKAFGCPPIR